MQATWSWGSSLVGLKFTALSLQAQIFNHCTTPYSLLFYTCAILASSKSFFSLASLWWMKSLSRELWPCMLYSLLVRSIPLCSSFTSRRTFSSETVTGIMRYTGKTKLTVASSDQHIRRQYFLHFILLMWAILNISI